MNRVFSLFQPVPLVKQTVGVNNDIFKYHFKKIIIENRSVSPNETTDDLSPSSPEQHM